MKVINNLRTRYFSTRLLSRVATESPYQDFRSDATTKPTEKMRESLVNYASGAADHDEHLNALERAYSHLFQKEDAMFVPSGSQGNIIALMAHASRAGGAAIVGSKSHIATAEQGSVSTFGSLFSLTIENQPDGTIPLEDVERALLGRSNIHLPGVECVSLENTHGVLGGIVLPLSYMQEARDLCTQHKAKLHLDGARVLNAAVSLGVEPSEITQYADSVMSCISKGGGCSNR